jgi:hypothetical protein
MFANDYNWKVLSDPVDSTTNQVDAVSQDDLPYGSCWPAMASYYMASVSLPIAFIPCALAGTGITSWTAGSNHQDRTTLYGSMTYRSLQAGSVRAVLWWQGEEEAINTVAGSDYAPSLMAFASDVYTDLGVKPMMCKLEDLSDWFGTDETQANLGIASAIANSTCVLAGPDFSPCSWGGAHYPAACATSIGRDWFLAASAVFGW